MPTYQEPTAQEWTAAASYSIAVTGGLSADADTILVIDYAADAARVYFGNRLLTDNWCVSVHWDCRCTFCLVCCGPCPDLQTTIAGSAVIPLLMVGCR